MEGVRDLQESLTFPDDVDVKINLMNRTVFAYFVRKENPSKIHKLLKETKELIPKSSCPQYFELDFLGLLAKVLEKQYDSAECCVSCIYQKGHLLQPDKL